MTLPQPTSTFGTKQQPLFLRLTCRLQAFNQVPRKQSSDPEARTTRVGLTLGPNSPNSPNHECGTCFQRLSREGPTLKIFPKK